MGLFVENGCCPHCHTTQRRAISELEDMRAFRREIDRKLNILYRAIKETNGKLDMFNGEILGVIEDEMLAVEVVKHERV